MNTRGKFKASSDRNLKFISPHPLNVKDPKKPLKVVRKSKYDETKKIVSTGVAMAVQMKRSLVKVNRRNLRMGKKKQGIRQQPPVLEKMVQMEMLVENNASDPKKYEPYQPRDNSFWMIDDCKQWTILDQIIKLRSASSKDFNSNFQLQFSDDSGKLTETNKISVCRNWTSLHYLICSRYNKRKCLPAVAESSNFVKPNDFNLIFRTNLFSSAETNESLLGTSATDRKETTSNNFGYMTQQRDVEPHAQVEHGSAVAAVHDVPERAKIQRIRSTQEKNNDVDISQMLLRLKCHIGNRLHDDRHRKKCLKSLRMFEKVYFRERPPHSNSILTFSKSSQISTSIHVEGSQFDRKHT